jgi:PAS domain S-box-containing protein
LFINRSNFLEETYFSWSIIPMVGGDGTVTGLYNPAFEKTRRKIVERRMLTLREVGERTATARDVKSFWQQVSLALECNELDSPYVLLYSVSEESDSDSSSVHSSSLLGVKQCYLEGSLGVQSGHPSAPAQIDLKTGMEGFGPIFRDVMKSGKPVLLRVAGTEEEEVVQGYEMDSTVMNSEKFQTDVGPELSPSLLEDVDWRGFGDPCRSVVVCPVHPTTADLTLGFMVLGVNPRRPYDDDYSLFVQLLSRQLATSLASVVLFEEEIRRGQKAARLAAKDRIELSNQLAARTQEARDSETRFTRMAEFSPAGLFIADSAGHITYCNDTWYEITRVPKDSGFMDNWIEAVSEEDQQRVRNLWYELVEHCRSVTAEFRFKAQWEDRNGNKSDTWVLFSAYPETYSEEGIDFMEGGLKSVFGSLTNISQQKWAEGFQKRKMEEAVELKRQQENFIDITSHEMRNPLSAILQCADEISTRLGEFRVNGQSTTIDDELLANSIDAAQTIMLCAQHQKTIVDDVLTLSKLDSQMLLVTPVDVQPVVVVQRALKMFENEIQNADITMRFHVDESMPRLNIDWVRVDPQRLLQVLINLTTNAIKFTTGAPTREITVTVAASLEKPDSSCGLPVDFFPSHKKGGNMLSGADWGDGDRLYIQFAVQDTGRGLTVEEKKMLFLRFSQASPRTHIQYGGSGLGLFISRELTELQGGEIGVSSVAGKGSTFAFYVRARRSKKPSDPDQQFPALVKALTQESKPKRVASVKARDFATVSVMHPNSMKDKSDIGVLIVEVCHPFPCSICKCQLTPSSPQDNLVNQRVLQKQLINYGFTVSVANHGGECLDHLRESAFWHENKGRKEASTTLSVILMDQEMPVMDGLQCTKTIREWERANLLVDHVPIIGVTANARVEQIQALLMAGMVSSLPCYLLFCFLNRWR